VTCGSTHKPVSNDVVRIKMIACKHLEALLLLRKTDPDAPDVKREGSSTYQEQCVVVIFVIHIIFCHLLLSNTMNCKLSPT